MAVVESLEVQLAASARSAAGAIDEVNRKLDGLLGRLSAFSKAPGICALNGQMKELSKNLEGAGAKLSESTKTIEIQMQKAFKTIEQVTTQYANLQKGLTFSDTGNAMHKQINAYSNALKRFEKIDASSMYTISAAIKNLSGGMKSMQGIDTGGITNFAQSLSKIGTKNAVAGTENLLKAKDNLAGFITQMNSIGSLTFDTTRLSDLINGISRLGGTAATKAVANIPNLATAVKNLMGELSKAPKVNQNLIDMTNALAKLARTGSSSGKAANSLNHSFEKLPRTFSVTTSAIKGMQNNFRNLLRSIMPFVGAFQLISFGRQAMEISSELTEVQNVVDVTFGDMAHKIERLSKTSVKDFGMSELTAKQISSRFQAMGTAMGYSQEKMSDMSIELTKLSADMASFYNVAQEDVAKNLQSIFTGETEPLRKYGLDLTQATLQEWALKNGLDADMQSMSQAEKTMLRYQYVLANTTAAQGDFARTSGTWANQIRILRQQLEQLASTIGGTLINAFKPFVQALNTAMSHVTAFAETVSNALGKIFGWKYEKGGGGAGLSGLVEDTDDLKGGLGEAEKAAKKLNRQLQGFDALNLLTSNTDGAGGGTGAAGGTEGQGGQWVQAESMLEGYESRLDTLHKLGKYIGDKLSEAMERIDWDSVYEKAKNFGTGLADFLNGLISPRLFGNVGKTIAGSLNTALHFLDSFGETFDWKNFGESLAAGVNNFFETFDFALLAHTINTWANGLLDAVIEFIDGTEWEMIGEQIGTFLEGINFTEIGIKMGKALWKAINAGIKVFSGMFKKAPVETAVITLMGIPKVLKAIVNTKFVKGIQNLVSNFKKFGGAAKLAFSGLGGNMSAITTLTASFPKLGKAVDVLQDSFQRLMFGFHFKDYAGGINAAITNIRDNLTGIQKGALTAAAGFAEFKVVSNVFEGLTLGTENLLSGIAKIAGTVAAAASAMYVAFGPAGAAFAAITGVAAAIKGINDAFDAVRAEEIGNTIKNAMSNPGGVPLSEITSGFANALSEAAGGFDIIKEKSSELDSVQKNIENTWLEIYKIEEAMENGVLSVEEGKAQLETLFSELATLTEQKFSAMNTAIMSAYGEGGSFRTAMDKLGADTEAAIDTMITYGYQSSERAKEIAQELTGMDIDSEEYKNLVSELSSLTGEMSSFEQATSDFAYNMNSLKGQIDYSEIFPDGKLDTKALQGFLDEASTALNDYETSLDTAGQEISRQWQEIINSTATTEEQKAVAKAQLDYIPQAIKSMKSDAELEIIEFTDMIQNDFISQTGQIIDDSISEWENKGFWGQVWNRAFGAGTEGEYVKEAVDQQQKNIDELSAAIEGAFGNLQTEGVAWASDAAEEIYGALFDSQYIHSEMGSGHYKYTLNENYKDIINGATEGIAELASERGKDAVDGYANSFTDNANTEKAQNSAKSFVDRVMEAIAEAQDSHSPSKVTESLGKDAVDGYNLGISDNTQSTLNTIGQYMQSVKQRFSDLNNVFNEIGAQAMKGFLNGMSDMEKSLYDKANSIADNVAKTVKNSLEIHSPSRVMFELGDFTMRGFKNGIESLYQPILKSIEGFDYDLQVAPNIGIEDIYGNYKSSVDAYTPQYGISDYSQNSNYGQNNDETNALLRQQNELLRAILQKPNISKGEVFDAFESEYQEKAIRLYGTPTPGVPVLG